MKKLQDWELSRNRSILRSDVILQHDWSIEQCLHHIRVSLAGKRRVNVLIFSLIGWWNGWRTLHRNHFSKSYENRSIHLLTGASLLALGKSILCICYPRCRTSRLGRTGVKFSGLVISDATEKSVPRLGAFAGDVAFGFAITLSIWLWFRQRTWEGHR